ncbi:ADP-ribose pyrophosphatase [Halanaerobium saccharolyticum]|uniref:ADP-ribose pyrophosphatase n=1 Tax=Halanaerobium saccharolyticum TaxID=43595 RepID=A0A4R7Z885_9FIRM|nr:NUDIX hydrolase [Halanaerobium saccharolyticum]RAK11069.1 ADP-ribose pyrophosphatase [Halanaerobium saccharolyticum]TDW06920.1 ADP-ribose pyrophosphatase [Halanaerobium saccharolyticum]TDX63685.1 ADP-ribose pyrophosphatase [Halanaerobium saccharolyticum]
MEIKKEIRTASETIYEGNILKLYRDEVEFPNKHKSTREVVEHSGGVSVLAENEEGKILLIRQYRYPVDEVIYEIPAGKLELEEKVEECARRELREETGYTAEKFSKLFEFFPTPGYSTETIYIYQAENLKYVGRDLEEGEYIEVVPQTKAELKELMQSGKIKDSKTLIAVMHYLGDF